MTEYNLILMEKILDGSASAAEKAEFEQIMINEPEMKKEFEEQKHIKEVLKMVQLKTQQTKCGTAIGRAFIIVSKDR